ncbi:MAG TPA: rod shape-determining protein MreD [Rhodobacteraceae bacterium]|nr:rod shape-determining protein MreD [Paracoccaceae bacterium]
MDSLSRSRIWTMRAVYAGLALVVIFFHLLPLDTLPRRWAPPDLIVAITFAWALRRPDFVPPLLVALVMLTADLMFHRPPGLWAFLVVAGVEYLKGRFEGLRDASFLGEWAAVFIVLVTITLLNRTVLGLTGVPQAPLALTLTQMLLTGAIYPLAVGVSQSLMGVRKLTPGESDAMGGRA